MSYTVKYVMEFPTGLSEMPELPDILTQRILAEGYVAHSADAGKSIFKRNWGWTSKASFALQGGNWDEIPAVLTVSYIPTPGQTIVKLKWESSWNPSTEAEKNEYGTCIEHQFDTFRKHVKDWLPANRDRDDV